jgi:hypothetical protein
MITDNGFSPLAHGARKPQGQFSKEVMSAYGHRGLVSFQMNAGHDPGQLNPAIDSHGGKESELPLPATVFVFKSRAKVPPNPAEGVVNIARARETALVQVARHLPEGTSLLCKIAPDVQRFNNDVGFALAELRVIQAGHGIRPLFSPASRERDYVPVGSNVYVPAGLIVSAELQHTPLLGIRQDVLCWRVGKGNELGKKLRGTPSRVGDQGALICGWQGISPALSQDLSIEQLQGPSKELSQGLSKDAAAGIHQMGALSIQLDITGNAPGVRH